MSSPKKGVGHLDFQKGVDWLVNKGGGMASDVGAINKGNTFNKYVDTKWHDIRNGGGSDHDLCNTELHEN